MMPWMASFYQRTPEGRTLYRRVLLSSTVELWQQRLGESLVTRSGQVIHKGTMLGEPVIEWKEDQVCPG